VSKEKRANISASIRQHLLNLAHQRKEEFQFVLVRYAAERLLYRLGLSPHADKFLLKGALLFQLWTGQPHRSTLDIDLLGKGHDDISHLETVFREICTSLHEDGLQFPPDQVKGEAIREEQRYAGVRIHGVALLGTARIPLQIDIGFGDAVTPDAEKVRYPSLLGLPTATLRVYPKETVVAEKFEAMVSLGIANSRMKDFYDIWVLASQFTFDGAVLGQAIAATFQRRGTAIPEQPPLALTPEFSDNPAKTLQWTAFVARGRLLVKPPALRVVVEKLDDFLWPLVQTLNSGNSSPKQWSIGQWE
jgi:predicted nucleotidyltransferase component of viral defense system